MSIEHRATAVAFGLSVSSICQTRILYSLWQRSSLWQHTIEGNVWIEIKPKKKIGKFSFCSEKNLRHSFKAFRHYCAQCSQTLWWSPFAKEINFRLFLSTIKQNLDQWVWCLPHSIMLRMALIKTIKKNTFDTWAKSGRWRHSDCVSYVCVCGTQRNPMKNCFKVWTLNTFIQTP